MSFATEKDCVLDFNDPAELNRQYRIAASVPPEVFKASLDRYAQLSAHARDRLPHRLDIVYDSISGETLDLFHDGSGLSRPVLVFIHGGYWRMLSKNESAFMAEPFVRNGITIAALDYTLAPKATLEEIVRQIHAALAFLHREGRHYSVDPERIYVSGSSAGGHLTAAAVMGGWHGTHGVSNDIVKGAFPVSGLFDLRPLPRTFINEWLQFDEARAAALSPLLHLPRAGCPVHLFWGDGESQAFKAQSRVFAQAWQKAGFAATATEVSTRHHFDVVLDLADERSALAQRCLSTILQTT